MREVYPNWVMTQSQIRNFQFPLWCSNKNMGEPYLADPKSLAGNPLRWILAFMTPSFLNFLRAWALFFSLFAAYFTYRLVRLRGASSAAAWTGAILASLNGFFMAHLSYPNLFASAACIPAVAYFLLSRRWIGLGFALALQWLSGYPPFSLMTVLGTILMVAVDFKRFGSSWLRGAFLGGALTAFQSLPFLEYLRLSLRPTILYTGDVVQYSIPWQDLLKELFLPQWIWLSPKISGDPVIVCFYMGVPACLLAIWAVLKGGKYEQLLGAGGFFTLFLCLGQAIPGYRDIPLFHVFRFPANWLCAASAILPILAALGIHHLPSKRVQWGMSALIAMDLFFFAQTPLVAWFDPAFITQMPPTAKAVLSQPVPARLYTSNVLSERWNGESLNTREDFERLRDALPPSLGTAYGIREASSYQVLQLKRTERYLRRMEKEGPASDLVKWAGIGAVGTISKENSKIAASEAKMIALQGYEAPLFLVEKGLAHKLVVKEMRPGRVRGGIFVEKPATLVFSEVEYPGWRVLLDDRLTPHQLFQETFMAVPIPAGAHLFEFVYRPASFRLGALIALGVLGWVGFLLWRNFKKSRRR